MTIRYSLANLPSELLIKIVEDPSLSKRDLSAVRIGCRRLSALASPTLFSNIRLEFKLPSSGTSMSGRIINVIVNEFAPVTDHPTSIFTFTKKLSIFCTRYGNITTSNGRRRADSHENESRESLNDAQAAQKPFVEKLNDILSKFSHFDVEIDAQYLSGDVSLPDFLKTVCRTRMPQPRIDLSLGVVEKDNPCFHHVSNAYLLDAWIPSFSSGAQPARDRVLAEMLLRCPNLQELRFSRDLEHILDKIPESRPLSVRRWVTHDRDILSVSSLRKLPSLSELVYVGGTDPRKSGFEDDMWANFCTAGIRLKELTITNATAGCLRYVSTLGRTITNLVLGIDVEHFTKQEPWTDLASILWSEAVPAVSQGLQRLSFMALRPQAEIMQNGRDPIFGVIARMIPIDNIKIISNSLVDLKLSLAWNPGALTSLFRAFKGCTKIRDILVMLEGWQLDLDEATSINDVMQAFEKEIMASSNMFQDRNKLEVSVDLRFPTAPYAGVNARRLYRYALTSDVWMKVTKSEDKKEQYGPVQLHIHE